MRSRGSVAACGFVGAFLSCGVGLCRAQESDVGTAAARMADPSATIVLQVTADGDYKWKLDRLDKGQITQAMGVKRVMTGLGPHEITAIGADGITRFDLNFTVASGKPNTVRITTVGGRRTSRVGSSAAASPTPTPTANPNLPVTSGTARNPSAGNPDMFVRITPSANSNTLGAERTGIGRQAATYGWQVTLMALPMRGTYYDVKVQMVMKGVGNAGSTIELPDPEPGPVPSIYMMWADQLGKEAIVCYTARPASQQAQRWTGTFTIRSGYRPGIAAFIATHEPTLEPASDAPCGGIRAAKAAPAPETAPMPDTRASEMNSQQAQAALARGSRLYNERRYAESRPLLIAACDGGASMAACNSVGFMYQTNTGVATDYATARGYYLKACNDDSSMSCNNLGTLYRDGLGVRRDSAQALTLFEKGCDAGVLEGCDAAGKMYRDQPGVAQDGPRALAFFTKACDGDLAARCGNEAYVYAKGIGVPRDMAFAASLFTRACGLGSRNSCFSIGMIYQHGDGVPRDLTKAKEYLSKGCAMGDQESCGAAQQ